MVKRCIIMMYILVLALTIGSFNVWSATLPSKVRIAVVMPFTGPLALNGQEVKEGAELAAKLINDRGGIKGRTKIELIYGDSRCNPTNGVSATQRLIARGIDLYIGNYCSSVSLATMPILKAAGIPQIILSYAPSITAEARTPNSVRIGPSAPLEMAPLAKYAVTVNGDKTFAALALNNDFGRAMAEEFAKTVAKLGGKVVNFQYYQFGADFSTYLTKIKTMDVDGLLIIAMGNDTISFTKSYFELGLKTNVYTGDNFVDTQYVKNQKPKPQNLFYPWLYDDNSPRTKEVPPREAWIENFEKAFRAEYGREPTRNNVWGFACVRVFEQAIAALGTTNKKKIAEYLHSGAKFRTPFGHFGFEWCGQAVNKAGIGKYKNETKLFLKGKSWGDDVIPDLCPTKK